MARLLRLLTLGVCLVLVGCQADATLRVDVKGDGSGTVLASVNMDAATAGRTVLFDNIVVLDDLRSSGWAVSGPSLEPDGKYWIRLSKGFIRPEEVADLVGEVGGPDGPFQNFSLARDRSFAKRSWTFKGTVDLRRGLATFSDEEVAKLVGSPLGQRPEDMAAENGGSPIETAVKVAVEVHLPGELGNTNGVLVTPAKRPSRGRESTTTTVLGETKVVLPNPDAVAWRPSFADPAPLEVTATSSSTLLMPRIWRWLALAALVVGVGSLVVRLLQMALALRRDRIRAQQRRVRRVAVGATAHEVSEGEFPRGTPEPVVAVDLSRPRSRLSREGISDNDSDGIGLQVVALDAAGVLFAGSDPVNDRLVPYARSRGCTLSAGQIGDWYVARVVGGLAAGDFWTGLGVSGDPLALDNGYSGRYELNADVEDFLRQARDRGLEVVVIGDEIPEWTTPARQRFVLDGLVGTWLTSSELGVRLPHGAFFDAIVKDASVSPSGAMVMSRHVPVLDAAKSRGLRTVQFLPNSAAAPGDHAALRTFARSGA